MVPLELEGGRVLVVEDDDIYREVLQKTLQERKFNTLGVASVDRAIASFDSFDPHYVIADIGLPLRSGLELLAWVREKRPRVPVIMITGGGGGIDADAAIGLGASAFLLKPFPEDALIHAVCNIPRPSDEVSRTGVLELRGPPVNATSHPEFVRIWIDDFLHANEIRHPIYIRFPTPKGIRFFKAADSSDKVSLVRILNYKRKGGDSIYLRREDVAHYVGFRLVAEADENGPKIDPEEKNRFLGHSIGLLEGLAFSNEVPAGEYARASTLVESAVQLAVSSDQGYRLLHGMRELSEKEYARALAVSLVSSMIVRRIGWTALRNLTRVAMSGVFHDVGKLKLPKELLSRPASTLTGSEKARYEAHPIAGGELLSDGELMPNDVVQAIVQQNERRDGSGFPRRLTNKNIFPMAKVLGVANEYCHRLFEMASRDARDAKAAVAALYKEEEGRLDLDALVGLHQLFDVPLPRRLAVHAARNMPPVR